MRKEKLVILYEDTEILVCRKPSGLPVQTQNAGRQDLVNLLRSHRAQNKEEPYIGLVHRLDQPVEGVMVFAKTKKAAAHLSRQVAERSVGKYYLAVTDGKMDTLAGELEDYLLRDGKTNVSQVVQAGMKDAKLAKLSYEVLATDEEKNTSFVKIHLLTGRHHQIRVQMSHAGYPLKGDRKYHPSPDGAGSVALCSYSLTFSHPKTGERMTYAIWPDNRYFEPFSSCASRLDIG